MKPEATVAEILARLGIPESAIERFSPAAVEGVRVKDNRIFLDGPIVSTFEARLFKAFGLDLGFVNPEDFRKAMDAISGDVEIYINSPGGSVFDASVIQSVMIDRQKTASVAVIVSGIAASAASFITMTGDPIKIAPLGMIMVHEASTAIRGQAPDLRKAADLLDKINDSVADMLAESSNLSPEDAREKVREETWWTAKEALDLGLADEVLSAEPESGPDAAMGAASRLTNLAAQLSYEGGVL